MLPGMRVDRGVRLAAALEELAKNDELTASDRARIRAELEPVAAQAAHGLAVAHEALNGPDPEMGALMLAQTVDALLQGLRQARARLPRVR